MFVSDICDVHVGHPVYKGQAVYVVAILSVVYTISVISVLRFSISFGYT